MNYEVMNILGEVSRSAKGDTKQVSLVSWEQRQPLYDIRIWNDQQQPTGKGVSFTEQELYALYRILHEKYKAMPPNLAQVVKKWQEEVPIFYHALERMLRFFREAAYEQDDVLAVYEGRVAILPLAHEVATLQQDFPNELAKLQRLLVKVHYEKVLGEMGMVKS